MGIIYLNRRERTPQMLRAKFQDDLTSGSEKQGLKLYMCMVNVAILVIKPG